MRLATGLPRQEARGARRSAALSLQNAWAPAAVVLVVAATIALDAFWLRRFRSGYLTEWDESGYMAIALSNTHALLDQGFVHFLRTVEVQGGQAPLLPLVAVPFHLVAGAGVGSSLAAVVLFAAALVLATYGLAATLLPSGWAALAAFVVAGTPAVIDYSRIFHFAVPAAAMLTAALWALLRSDGLRGRGWALAAGVLVGLTLLSRTMTVAFLPAVAVAGGLAAGLGPGARPRRLANLALGGLAAGIVAALWYARNARQVWAYLSNAGYGSGASRFGGDHSPASLGYWTADVGVAANHLYLPLASLVGLCLLLGLALAVGRLRVPGWWASPRVRDTLAVAAVPVGGYLALASSTNEGTGFDLPLLPPVIVLAVVAAARLRFPPARSALALLFCVAAIAGFLTKSGLVPPLAAVRTAAVPGGGTAVVGDGRGIIQIEVAGARYPIGPPTRPLPAVHRRWLPFEERFTRRMLAYGDAHDQRAFVVFAVTHPLFNDTRISLAGELVAGRLVEVGTIDIASTVSAYARELRANGCNFLVTGAPGLHPDPAYRPELAARAALRTGFRRVQTFRLPDGQGATLWWRDRPPPDNHYYG